MALWPRTAQRQGSDCDECTRVRRPACPEEEEYFLRSRREVAEVACLSLGYWCYSSPGLPKNQLPGTDGGPGATALCVPPSLAGRVRGLELFKAEACFPASSQFAGLLGGELTAWSWL